jgi:hypothetical protein
MPKALSGEEGRDKLRKWQGSGTYMLILLCPNGATQRLEESLSLRGGKRGELKHLSTPRKRKQQ